MLNAGFQYLEQRDANDKITKDGVVGKNSPFATSDNSGIYDIIAENLRWLKENVDDVKDTSDLEAIKQSVTDMYNDMKNNSAFGEAAAKAQAEEAKKQAQAALESATNAKTYHDEVMAKSTEINDTIAEIKAYIEKAEKLIESNKELEQTLGNYVTVASNKAQAASDSATNAATSESNAATSAEHAATSETNAKTSETNAANSAAKAKESETNLETAVSNAATSATNAKASETNAKSSETNSKASEVSAKTYETNASNSANLAKAWAESNESPDSMNDTDSTTGKTQSSKSWALYSRDRAISAYNSEANASASESKAKASETNAKISETNAATSAEHAATSEVNASTSESHAATSEANAKTSETNARSSETNSKASEANARTSETNASNSADLSKKWAESSDSPDSVNDTDSTTGKTQSSKSWALYARDRAISAYSSESNAKASETASKTSETNAKTSETNAATSEAAASASASNAKTSEINAKTSEVNAKTSETNASTSKSNAATSESNAKSYMATAKEYMQKAQEALAAAQAIQSIVDTAKANAEKCLADVEAVKESLAKMITYQGSVDNYSDLPTNPQVGYSYNVKNADKEHGVNAGDNLVWNGEDWDNFGGAIDMSLFAELGKDVKFNTVTATTFTGSLNGNAATATNLRTARSLNLGGAVTADAATFDGTADTTINVKTLDATKLKGTASVSTTGNAATATKATQDTNGRAFTDTNAYMHISALANNTDFNNVKTTGIYYCTGDTYPNRPHNAWGILTVYSIGTVKQEYRPDDAAVYYTRKNNTGEWGEWSKVAASTADSATKAKNDSNGANIASTYVKKAGDTTTGKITFASTDLNSLPEVKKTSDDNMSGVRFSSKTKFLGAVGKRLSNGEDLLNLRSDNTTTDVVLDSRNYTNYAPTKTGSGASGTWGINITGNAASATNVSGKIYYSADSLSIATDKLLTIKQAHMGDDNVPSNGLVIQTGPTGAAYNGKLYITDNGTEGVWIGGVLEGKEVGWTRLVENKGSWNINSATATKLATARTISLTGNASGSASFDGSGNISINTTVNNADKVDGYHESSFLRYRGDAAANGEDTYWSQIGIKRYEGKLPQGISGTYNYGGVLSLPAGAGARLDIWYNHQCSTNGDGLWYRSGYSTDKKAWARLLDSVNYTNYVPTKTGRGASGTWNISVSGNAATATSATTAATCTGNSATATKATTALNIPTSDVGGNIWIS